MEIEKKYLVKELPEDLSSFPSRKLTQSYISRSPVIRLRKIEEETSEGKTESYVLTVKGDGLSVREEFELLLREAYQIVLVSDAYHEGCYRQRNQFMIDHSSLLIAAANRNSKSGSAQTINMAKRQAVPVRLIDTTGEPYSL